MELVSSRMQTKTIMSSFLDGLRKKIDIKKGRNLMQSLLCGFHTSVASKDRGTFR